MEEEQLRFKIEERNRSKRKRQEFENYHKSKKKAEEEEKAREKARKEFKVKKRLLEPIKDICKFMEIDNIKSINKYNIEKQFRKL